jgi:hypothetical protein
METVVGAITIRRGRSRCRTTQIKPRCLYFLCHAIGNTDARVAEPAAILASARAP